MGLCALRLRAGREDLRTDGSLRASDMIPAMSKRVFLFRLPFIALVLLVVPVSVLAQTTPGQSSSIVLHAARLLDIETGKIVAPGEVLVRENGSLKLGPW